MLAGYQAANGFHRREIHGGTKMKGLPRKLRSLLGGYRSSRSRFSNSRHQAAPARSFDTLENRCLLSTLSIDGAGMVRYVATETVVNNLSISISGGNYIFNEPNESINVIGSGSGGCTGTGGHTVTCPNTAINSMLIDVGDAEDHVTIQSLTDPATIFSGLGDDTLDGSGATVAVTADGGIGNDSCTGGPGGDVLAGDNGDDTLTGGAGDDTVSGGPGNDSLLGGTGVDEIVE